MYKINEKKLKSENEKKKKIVKEIWGKLGVCLVWFRSVFMGMANQNQIFQFVKFLTEIDRNGWKSIGFGVFRF